MYHVEFFSKSSHVWKQLFVHSFDYEGDALQEFYYFHDQYPHLSLRVREEEKVIYSFLSHLDEVYFKRAEIEIET